MLCASFILRRGHPELQRKEKTLVDLLYKPTLRVNVSIPQVRTNTSRLAVHFLLHKERAPGVAKPTLVDLL